MYELLIVILVFIDQFSKLKLKSFLEGIGTYPVIGDIFHLTYVENRGAAFGLMQNKQLFFIIATIVVLIIGLWIIHNKKYNRIYKLSISFIIAGAIGNLIDRIRLGYVIDFFDFRFIWNYVFNFADVLVVVGTFLVVIILLKGGGEKK